MEKPVRLLVIGDRQSFYDGAFPDDVEIVHRKERVTEEDVLQSEVILVVGALSLNEIQLLIHKAAAYRLYVLEEVDLSLQRIWTEESYKKLKESKYIQILLEEKLEEWLFQLSVRFWTGRGGNRLGIGLIDLHRQISGTVKYHGNESLSIEARFGTELSPILSWRINQAVNQTRRRLQIYLECQCTENVQAELRIMRWKGGQVAGNAAVERISLPMQAPYEFDREQNGYLSLEIWAGGTGCLTVGNLHFRESRDGIGEFIPGGVRHSDSMGDEFFSYLDPGDCDPPLCVYFSGYRNQEGFEGYGMMRELGVPFLLLSDPRLEGGAFYVGSREYEENLERTIREALSKLGFTNKQLILSGLSMGTYGAMYYGASLLPHAILAGKPLMNGGTIAAVQRTIRPGVFNTAMDVLLKMEGRTDDIGVRNLDQRMWLRFDKADFSDTKFAIAYMQQDDYDPGAYERILEHLQRKKTCIYGKGFPGRHNDNSQGVVQWFKSQYRKILREDYGRQNLSDVLGS